MQKKILNYFLIVTIFFSFSCTTKKIVSTYNLTNVENNYNGITTFFANGTIEIENKNSFYSATFELKFQNKDSLLLKIFGPFGITIAQFFFEKNSFQLYNSIENTLETGNIDSLKIENLFERKLTKENFISIFGMYNIDLKNIKTEIINGETFFVDEIQNKKNIFKLNFEENVFTNSMFLENNKKKLEQKFSDFDKIGNINFPNKIWTTFTENDLSIVVNYDDIKINETIDFDFVIPKNAKLKKNN